MYKKIVIGIDQSYKRLGISICADRELKTISSIKFGANDTNTQKRKEIAKTVRGLTERLMPRCNGNLVIICERVRLRSKGFISEDYIKSTSALIATIVDVAQENDINVYSVDTRCWKAQVVGTSKPEENKWRIAPEKYPTIKYIKSIGRLNDILIPYNGRFPKSKGIVEIDGKYYMVNDDAADSACIALFGFVGDQRKLLLEH